MDDIPEALREASTSNPMSRQTSGLLMVGGLSIGVLIVIGGLVLMRPGSQPVPTTPATTTPEPVSSPSPEPVDNILGHLPYKEASLSQLKAITPDGRIKLRLTAADEFLKMQAAARSQGVILAPISGFRTVNEQNYLFFEVQRQRNQNPSKRAEVSAPPNYSEHHTGYAIDIGDGKAPGTNLTPSFENTAAFNWLRNNAAKYSFELSFPPNNPQGISYEPWHWRYVGDQDSLETFYKARNLQQKPSN